MCGIVGYYSPSTSTFSNDWFDRCRDKLSHRGPDSSDSMEDRGLHLGFRRLAILDLSPTGRQPMVSSDGRYVIVLNGEIYNFLELRAELEAEGLRFRSSSDTEVVLALFARHGIACLQKLNGMFALAIYDRLERTVHLVRDRLGVKPLFYLHRGRTLGFASELRALRSFPTFPTEIDSEALGFYFRLGAVPEWSSIYPGVTKLAPGCWVRHHLESGRLDGPTTYWDLPPVGEQEERTEDAWVDEIEALLWDATRIRLRSDVPLGVFLSGGIDSGLVAAAAVAYSKGLTALTIGYNGEEDETSLAAATARQLSLHAVIRKIDLREGMEVLPQVMAHFDEPFSDTSALPTSLVCAEARKELTVALSGDGGDEVFGGYRNHVRAWTWRSIDRVPSWWRRAGGALFASLMPRDSASRRFFLRLRQPVGRFGLGAMLYPHADWLDDCLKSEFNVAPDRIIQRYSDHLPAWQGASSVDMSQRIDLRTYMLEDILVKVDRMSMMHSLEVRSPFLDYRLVELGLRVPSRLRVKDGQNKYLLRRLAARHLPTEVCLAPKAGFGIPLLSWLRSKSNQSGLPRALADNHHGYPDPFVPGGAKRLWRLGLANPGTTYALPLLLGYRWWCEGQAAPLPSRAVAL
ncbi:MAG: asparagine synthase (glutamine-hydrolyzing) [Burkholderiales bacterium]|nr:asparagine synthase (glutamine-hydrolyzing) [Burkholderiales bacterium]